MNATGEPALARTVGTPDAYSLGETCTCLVRAFQLERGLVQALGGWMAGVVYWDAKLALGDHLWDHARNASGFLARLHELKEMTAERQECEAVARFLATVTAAVDGDAFLHGVYGVVLPRLASLYREWAGRVDPVMDPFSGRRLLDAARRLDDQREWFEGWTPAFTEQAPTAPQGWRDALGGLMERIDRARGAWDEAAMGTANTACEGRTFQTLAVPLRDACFRTAWVNEVAQAAGDSFADQRRTIFYNHTQEMQFAESLGAILHDTPEMPWAFHYDLARHCSDEVRHTRMGCTRLEQLGEDLRGFPMLLQNYSLRAKIDPVERFCMMTLVIEAASFEKKRANVKMFAEHGDTVSERYETYDIRDEMLHVNFGHTWVPIMLRVTQDARSVSDLVQACRDILNDAVKGERVY